jgi:iron(III) transport system permease protein
MSGLPGKIGFLVLFSFLILFVFFPVFSGIVSSLEDGGSFTVHRFADMFAGGKASTVAAIRNSIVASVLTVALGGIAGTLLAVATCLARFRLRRLAAAAAVIPVAMPPLVGVIALMFIYGEGGILPRLAGNAFGQEGSLFALDGFGGIVAVHVYAFHVYTFLFVSTALREIDASVVEAATMFGARSGRMFFRIILPELIPSLIGSASLTFMSSMASFSAPFLLGGGMPFLTTIIYSTKLNGDLGLAGAQSTVLLFISILFFALLTLSTHNTWGRTGRKGVTTSWTPSFSPAVERTLITLSVVLLVLEMLPLLTIVLISFAREGSWTWQLFPQEYTIENYLNLLTQSEVFQPVRNSLLMGGLTALLAAVTGTSLAFLLTKGPARSLRAFLDPLFTLPFAVPGTVVAISLIVTFAEPRWLTGGEVLLGTFWILPLAYFIRTYPLVLRSASSSLDRLDDSAIEAARMLGAGPVRLMRRVVLPMILPAIVSGSLLVLISALGEFPSSILLYAHVNRPVSVEILSQLRGYNFGSAAAYSMGLLGLVLCFSVLSGRMNGTRKKAAGRFHF